MKKLSILIALMLCVTIGGVYATWTYAGTNDIADADAEAKVTMAGATFTGANGVYEVKSNLVLTIDQKNSDHEAELKFESNDGADIYLTVTFTPASTASQTMKDYGVESYLSFTTTAPMQYTMDAEGNYSADGVAKDIFVFQPQITLLNNKEGRTDWVRSEAVVDDVTVITFTYPMDEAALKEAIKLNDNNGADPFVLDVKSEYEQFKNCLAGNIKAIISDGVVTDAPAET